MKKTTIFIICSLLLPCWISAQEEGMVVDYVMIDGERHSVRADPLYRYLCNACPEKLLDDYVNNFCDPYWPNYTRYWELKEDRLYLVKIETTDKKVEYTLDLLFPRYDGSPIWAVWFSGILSYRSGDSPAIMLNREYFEEENVVQLEKGRVVDRFKINHRERWISYAKRIMNKYRPLEGISLDFQDEAPGLAEGMAYTNDIRVSEGGMAGTNNVPDAEWGMIDYLESAFSIITHPKEKPSVYFPIIWINFNANLDDLKLTEAHQELLAYPLLEAIARETDTVLEVAVTNQVVIFEIRENELEKAEAQAAGVTDHAEDGMPSES